MLVVSAENSSDSDRHRFDSTQPRLESVFDNLAHASVLNLEAGLKIAVNGTADQFPENSTIRDILASKTLQEEIVIVFLNGEMTKNESWADTRLKSGDKIEIIRVVGGG